MHATSLRVSPFNNCPSNKVLLVAPFKSSATASACHRLCRHPIMTANNSDMEPEVGKYLADLHKSLKHNHTVRIVAVQRFFHES